MYLNNFDGTPFEFTVRWIDLRTAAMVSEKKNERNNTTHQPPDTCIFHRSSLIRDKSHQRRQKSKPGPTNTALPRRETDAAEAVGPQQCLRRERLAGLHIHLPWLWSVGPLRACLCAVPSIENSTYRRNFTIIGWVLGSSYGCSSFRVYSGGYSRRCT